METSEGPKHFQGILVLKRFIPFVTAASMKHLGESGSHSVDERAVMLALTEIIFHEVFATSLTKEAVQYSLDTFDRFYDQETRDEAMVVSLARLVHVTDWNPMDLNICRAVASDNVTYICLRNAVGMLALAWQAARFPDRIVLTSEQFVKIRDPVKS